MAQHNFSQNFPYEVPPYYGGDHLLSGASHAPPYPEMPAPALTGKKTVSVDVGELIRTRDALNSAYMGLSSAIERAVKAYLDHINVVLSGDGTLNVSFLTQPFEQLSTTSHLMQQALHAVPQVPPNNAPEGPAKQKRKYKQRDPNAPKRPLTAYFRYLQEMRGPLAIELAAAAGGTPQKPGDLSKVATERWNKLSKEEQQPYRDAYQRALKDYEREVQKYKSKTDDGTMSALDFHTEANEDEGDDSSDESSSSSSSEDDSTPPPPKASSEKRHKKRKNGEATAIPGPPAYNGVSYGRNKQTQHLSPDLKRKTDDEGEKKKKKKRKHRSAGNDSDGPRKKDKRRSDAQ
ncbi:hypothetical protein K470DRAFT_266336 [Piedraia hortae CBS 480.64]|uniref:HMG box domain-containing protein n=1 Tax=Piedraia hortae CBS 480.64 TaxID=1314780 RepID=A0A6A7BS97_9PEZI|nr:hypothetical protein K470DRAFT_266336 [Piedraia hortae CBS 480.64]